MGLLTSLTRPNAGASQPANLQPMSSKNLASGAGAGTAGYIYLLRSKLDAARRITHENIRIYTGVSANIDLGWYFRSGNNLVRRDHSGEIACGSSGTLMSFPQLLATEVIPAGVDFWLAFGSDGAPTIVRQTSFVEAVAIELDVISLFNGYSSGLPATIDLTNVGGSAFIPWINAVLAR